MCRAGRFGCAGASTDPSLLRSLTPGGDGCALGEVKGQRWVRRERLLYEAVSVHLTDRDLSTGTGGRGIRVEGSGAARQKDQHREEGADGGGLEAIGDPFTVRKKPLLHVNIRLRVYFKE